MSGLPVNGQQVAVWTDARCAGLIGAVLGRLGLVGVRAVGGPSKAQVADLAESFDAPVHDDLRRMLIDHPVEQLLLATGTGLSAAGLQQAAASGTLILGMEPAVADAAQLTGEARSRAGGGAAIGGGVGGVGAAVGSGAGAAAGGSAAVGGGGSRPAFVPMPWLRMCPAWLSAADPQEALGAIRAVQVTAMGPPEAGTLYARLFDAVELLEFLVELPESVEASLVGALARPPEELRGLTGHLCAHLRVAESACAGLFCSDRAAIWDRRVTVLGSEGQLVLSDLGYVLYGPEGQELDRSEPEGYPAEAAELIARQWRRIADQGRTGPLADLRSILATCQAALLSCRTGEVESPQTLLRISGG